MFAKIPEVILFSEDEEDVTYPEPYDDLDTLYDMEDVFGGIDAD